MFTDRFIKIPIDIVNRANEDLGTKEEKLASTILRLNPLEIVSFRDHIDDDGNCDDTVTIELKNSDNLIAKIPLTEFEKLLNNYNK